MMLKYCLLFAFTVLSYSSTIAQSPQVPTQPIIIAPTVPIRYPVIAPPPYIYQPQIQYVPLQYKGSVYQPRVYRTPLRNWLFGIGTMNHYYGAPQAQ